MSLSRHAALLLAGAAVEGADGNECNRTFSPRMASTTQSLADRATPLLAARVRPAFGRSAATSAVTSADDLHVAVQAAGREFPVDVQLWGSDHPSDYPSDLLGSRS